MISSGSGLIGVAAIRCATRMSFTCYDNKFPRWDHNTTLTNVAEIPWESNLFPQRYQLGNESLL